MAIVTGLRSTEPSKLEESQVRVSVERPGVSGQASFTVALLVPNATVVASCECVHVERGPTPGEWRGVVKCREVPSFVTPGIFVYVDKQFVGFYKTECAP